jgi:hypothetical protein
VSAAPAFEPGERVLMHSLDSTRVWLGTIMPANEKTEPGHYRVEWDDDFVTSSIPADLLEPVTPKRRPQRREGARVCSPDG